MRGGTGSRKSKAPRSKNAEREGVRTLWRRHSSTARGPEAFPRESTEPTAQPVIQSPPSRRDAEMWQVFSLAASGASHPSRKPAPSFRRPTPGLHLNFAHLLESDAMGPVLCLPTTPDAPHLGGSTQGLSRRSGFSCPGPGVPGSSGRPHKVVPSFCCPFLLDRRSWDLLRTRNPDDQNVTKAPL